MCNRLSVVQNHGSPWKPVRLLQFISNCDLVLKIKNALGCSTKRQKCHVFTKLYHFSVCIHMQTPTVSLQITYSNCEFFRKITKKVILLTKSSLTSPSLISLSSYHLYIFFLIFSHFEKIFHTLSYKLLSG